MSDVMGMFLIALVVAGVAAVLFLNIFRKSALHLLLLSIHSALVGIGLFLLAYVVEGSEMLLLTGTCALLFGVFLSVKAFIQKD
ncbi:hypothetical protein [Paenibacillus lautus]|uniref:hypothetical protein n=1 Tax=Paenibacillus lautus TaxID=1401 RepID=UPI001C107FE5|nr:hypothetical protein [Paenibacillus lautus]MBU5349979.1 hypothetical protein [Paenibacillus lautus]